MMEVTTPRIFYLCPVVKGPVGGVKQIYRHVDILNTMGYEAYVVHPTKGFRCSFFDNETSLAFIPELFPALVGEENAAPVRRFAGVRSRLKNFIKQLLGKKDAIEIENVAELSPLDFLVLPEFYGEKVFNLPKENPKVIFNQGAHLTFYGFSQPSSQTRYPYLEDTNVKSTMVVSEHSEKLLRQAFPEISISRLYNGIDTKLFNLGSEKEKIISFVPWKLPKDVNGVLHALNVQGVLEGYQLVPIRGMTESEVAEVLKKSLLFLSFVDAEGLSLPALEAMACGCVVVGYDGFGGKEFMRKEFSYTVPARDYMAFVDILGGVLREAKQDRDSLIKKGKLASEFVSKHYSMEREKEGITDFWKSLLH